MSRKLDSRISGCESKDSKISWACRICKDLPEYAGMYLWQRESEKNKAQSEEEQWTDLLQMKYYCALLYLLDGIHNLSKCLDPECAACQFK